MGAGAWADRWDSLAGCELVAWTLSSLTMLKERVHWVIDEARMPSDPKFKQAKAVSSSLPVTVASLVHKHLISLAFIRSKPRAHELAFSVNFTPWSSRITGP